MKKVSLKLKIEATDSKLGWFWGITTKWYFFPLFYLFLSIVIYISRSYYNDVDKYKIFYYTLFFMPNGLFYFTYILTGQKTPDVVGLFFPDFYFGFLLILIIIMQFIRWINNKNIILRWLIIIVILIILLSFAGCVAGGREFNYLAKSTISDI